ncbi:hypothetical protein DPEC_G00345230 [Dallia pectoralis]|uniref:Uncharacterized protein n=1 Tax=Dallia pectoralis TaxID=75939 RepID=A0ACC2F3I0_DALPE|nr:hypothetical protein DPEC_G00345230 [Dallia pectoralis]
MTIVLPGRRHSTRCPYIYSDQLHERGQGPFFCRTAAFRSVTTAEMRQLPLSETPRHGPEENDRCYEISRSLRIAHCAGRPTRTIRTASIHLHGRGRFGTLRQMPTPVPPFDSQ